MPLRSVCIYIYVVVGIKDNVLFRCIDYLIFSFIPLNFLRTAKLNSKAQKYNRNTNITNVIVFLFSFFFCFFVKKLFFFLPCYVFIQNNKDVQKVIYSEPRPYASTIYTAVIETYPSVLVYSLTSYA